MSTADLTPQGRELYREVRARASSIDEQLLIITVIASRVAASSADIQAVRDLLLTGHTKECSG